MKLDTYPTLYKKINFRWRFQYQKQIFKHLVENVGECVLDLAVGKYCLNNAYNMLIIKKRNFYYIKSRNLSSRDH